jgi:hypothetical protein
MHISTICGLAEITMVETETQHPPSFGLLGSFLGDWMVIEVEGTQEVLVHTF